MKQYRFSILLVSLVLLALVFPFIDHFNLIELALLLNLFMTLILVSSIQAVSDNRRYFLTAVVIIAPTIVAGWGGQIFQGTNVVVLATVLRIVAMGFVGWRVLQYTLRRSRVDVEKINAAICVYFFIGVMWKDMYLLLDHLLPGSFSSIHLDGRDFLYFSFITLSTLGYGDITPVNGPARALAYLEALVGQLYLTVLVARLVGLYIARGDAESA